MSDKPKKSYCIQTDDADLVPQIESYADRIVWSPRDYAAPAAVRSSKPLYLHMPVYAGRADIAVLTGNFKRGGYAGVVANNPYALRLAEEWKTEIFAGSGLNILNQTAAAQHQNILLSPEIGEPDYRLFADWQTRNYFLYVYGRLPLMTLCHCPYVQVFGSGRGRVMADGRWKMEDGRSGCHCECKEKESLEYKDEKGNRLAIYKYKTAACYFHLLNAVPHNLVKYKNKIKPHYFFDFRACPPDTALKILAAFSDPAPREPEGPFTAGLYFK
ncbi:hypothetical protein FACS1894211_03020 [Clostridia bacterium]|nr:hypothetical protein FACS1894211_03020 [Clostridia bacterium]